MTVVDSSDTSWDARAEQLAAWASQALVMRTDGYGAYDSSGRSWTEKKKIPLTKDILRDHFNGTHTIGLHPANTKQECGWACWDFDLHDDVPEDERKKVARRNFEWVCTLASVLAQREMYPLIEDSNNQGGYHVWVYFDAPRPVWDVHAWMDSLVDELEFDKKLVEVFPKQAYIKPDGWGNFVRLPEKHHKREHWSRFWGDDEWYEGEDAVDFLLEWEPSSTVCMPESALPPPREGSSPPNNNGSGVEGLENIQAHLEQTRQINVPKAVLALDKLNAARADDHDTWIQVGMALHAVDPGPNLLAVWDAWSQKSGKYQPGECAERWKTFNDDPALPRVGLGTLIKWAREDEAESGRIEDRDPALKTLSNKLSENTDRMEVIRVIRRGDSEPSFDLELEDGRIVKLGKGASVLSFQKVRSAIFSSTGIVLSEGLRPPSTWSGIAKLIYDASEYVQTETEEDETRGWIDSAIANLNVVECETEDQVLECINNGNIVAFQFRGETHIHLPTLHGYVRADGNSLTIQQLSERLTRIDWKRKRLRLCVGGRETRPRTYVQAPGTPIDDA